MEIGFISAKQSFCDNNVTRVIVKSIAVSYKTPPLDFKGNLAAEAISKVTFPGLQLSKIFLFISSLYLPLKFPKRKWRLIK